MTARVKLYCTVDVVTPGAGALYADVVATFSGSPDSWRCWRVEAQRDRVDLPHRYDIGPRGEVTLHRAREVLDDPGMVTNGIAWGLDAVPGFGSAYASRLSGTMEACAGPAFAAFAAATPPHGSRFGDILSALRASRRIDLALRWRYPVEGDESTNDRGWMDVPPASRGWAHRWALDSPEVLRAHAAELAARAAIAEERARADAACC